MDKYIVKIPENGTGIITPTQGSTQNVFVLSKNSSESNDENEAQQLTPKKKRRVYKRKFKAAWQEKFNFIEQRASDIFCKVCNLKIVGGLYHIKRHQNSVHHIQMYKACKSTPHIVDLLPPDNLNPLMKRVKTAELKLVAFIAEHNLPFRLMDHLPLLCASSFPDSEVAKTLKLKRKKATQLIVGVLGPAGKADVIEIIQKVPFSLIIDESTDISLKKCLVVVVRFFFKDRVRDAFLDLIEVETSSAESLYEAIKKLLDENAIPYENLIGLAVDNASVMLGQFNSVQLLLKNNINPHIVVVGCTCHTFHLCSSYACKTLPDFLEKFVHDICNYFSKSSKRNVSLTEFQTFLEETPSRILQISKTRWLSLGNVISRLIEHWNSLVLFFQHESYTEKIIYAQEILNGFNSKINKCYLLFLTFVLAIVNKLNLEFQSESPKITVLLERVTNLYKVILKCFIKKTVLSKYEDKLDELVVGDPSNFLNLESMYFGAELELFLSDNNDIDVQEIQNFRRRCLDFYIELCKQIKKRFCFKNDTLLFASLFEPSVVLSGEVISVAKAKTIFPTLSNKIDLEELNLEWNLATEVGKKYSSLSSVEFWSQLSNQKDALNDPMFKNLMHVVQHVLALPHSSAAAERIFSQVNLIKIKNRNRLAVKTVASLLSCKELIHDDTCYTFNPRPTLCTYNKNIENMEVFEI